MTNYLLLFVNSALINNFILIKFLGLCPFIGISRKIETSIGMGIATTFVITFTSICAWIINHLILLPLNLVYLQNMVYMLVIAVVVQFTEMMLHKTSPILYRLLGIFLPLITTNCIVLGVPLMSVNMNYTFLQSTIYAFSSSIGFFLVIILFASMRERLILADIPAPFKGNSINLITAGLMALAFMGFTDLVKF
ncbi:electron transport complex subunit RsxA [Pantoea sp. Aalb]|uniref:electron transport complex subunit RsxA n=1 Tax=Pantoea sp. Aalb TaxID=2576762 RepID=UPI001326BAAF|nr:electron transport complex subunit RsxA [Pantoea sp. Aalb]MXP67409.1 electron transport complex subunit RsxA [Pantoea sp. Aalb]